MARAQEDLARFLDDKPKLEDVQYTVRSQLRAPGWLMGSDARFLDGLAGAPPAAERGEPAVGDPQEGGNEVTISAFNWQVNLTRLGISVFTLFLVQMLLSLQRYITRLSSFYSGRADAIQHFSEIVASGQGSSPTAPHVPRPGVSITPDPPEEAPSTMQRQIELMEALTPTGIPYGRPPAPDKMVVEVAKVVAGRQQAP